MRFGVVILPELSRTELVDTWRAAEALGFSHGWTYDHLNWRNLRDSAWFAAMPTLTAAAFATERMRLGTLVASPNFRHPVPTVREILALDHLSNGRFVFGFGAGGSGWDAEILGQEAWSPRERADRFEAFVMLTDRLLREREVSHPGPYYAAVEARSYPGCIQQPRVPFALAASGPRGMGLAARFADTWVTNGDRSKPESMDPVSGAAVFRAQRERFEAACDAEGRNPAHIDRLLMTGTLLDPGLASADAFADAVGRYAEAGVTDYVVHWPRDRDPYRGGRDHFEAILGPVLGGGA